MFSSSNLYSQSCVITSKANDILPDNLCAPVNVDWEITYRGVNDGGGTDGINPWSIEIQVDWDDGVVQTITATNTNPATHEWKITISHVYPVGGDKCNYKPTAQLVVDGVICTSSIQEQNVTVWDTDDYNGGHLEITPQIFPICVGNDGYVTFQDVSLWNCVPPVENDNPNNPMRWTQWVYGTSYTYNNVEVDGSVQTYSFAGNIVPTTEPIYGPTPPNNISLPCYGPNTGNVGEFWEITLRDWNYCNPYDDPNIPGAPTDLINGDYDPIITTAMIIVVDTPDATINPAGPFCLNHSSVNLSAATAGGTWSGIGITNTNNGTFNPSIAGAGTHTIHYTVTSNDGCVGTGVQTIIVYALPMPNILPGNPAEVCPNDILHLDGNPTPGDGNIITHLWTGNTTPLSSTNIQNPFFSTGTQGVYNLTYTVTDDNGCYNSENISVAVNPVDANIIPNPAEICAGENLTLNGNPSGWTGNYITHVWTGDVANLNVTNTQSVIFNSNVLGSYNFTYTVTDNNGCTGNDNITVTVFENPVANAGIDANVCSNTITLNAIPSIGNGFWQQISGPGISTFTDPTNATSNVEVSVYGLYSYEWAESFGPSCIDKDTVIIRFTEQPVADAGIDGGICGYNYQLNANPSVGTGIWTLQSGPGNIAFSDINSPICNVTADAYGNYYFIWTEDNGFGCTDFDYVLVSFNLIPTPSFNPINPDGCTPFTVNFTNTSTGGTTYNWDFGDGNSSTNENPTNIFYNNTTSDLIYYVQLAVNNPGCGDTIIQQVTVHPSPIANFTTNAQPACSPLTANFTSTSIGANINIWNWGDGSAIDTANFISHTFINDTSFIENYNVSIIAISANGCTDTSTQFVTVYPNQNNYFTVNPDSSCSPSTVSFVSQPTGQNYSWNFGNGTSEIGGNTASAIYTYNGATDTTFYISLITTSYFGCIDTSTNKVTIFASPTANFTINNSAGCAPVQVEFTNTSQGAISYSWNFGDGTIENNNSSTVFHNFGNVSNNAITYTITLTATNSNGCTSQKTKTYTVYPEIHAFFIADTTGCSELTVDFTNQSLGAVNYNWYFGDSEFSTETNPTHTYINNTAFDKNYFPQLIAISQYGCRDTFSREIIVYPQPEALFQITPNIVDLPNAIVNILNQTAIGNWTYLWNFGDGVNSNYEQPGNHTYQNYGTFNVWLYVYGSHCSDSVLHTVTVNAPQPIAAYFSSENGCVPLEVTFTNQSQFADTYYWDFGDGNQSNQENPVYTYYEAGTYQVSLTVTGPGGQDLVYGDSVVVYPKAEAFFKVAPSLVYIPDQPIHCYDMSENATIWYWEFGDNETSELQNPDHYYKEEGTYDISLTANNTHNCPDTYTIVRAVTADGVGEVHIPNAFTPSFDGSSDGKYDPNDFNNNIFHPVLSGVADENYAFRIFNRWGELIFETFNKEIGWDGYYIGQLSKQDVYVWTVEGKYVNGLSFFKKGDVTLLR